MGLRTFARWVSIVGHPFVLLMVYVVAASVEYLPRGQVLPAAGLVFVLAILPMTIHLQRQARRGVTNFDVSAQELRGPVYGLGLGLGLLLLVVFYGLGAPPPLLRGLWVGIVMVIVASLINLRLKVSLHSAFAAWVSLGIFFLYPRLALVLGAWVLLVTWSRLKLERHSLPEVIAGVALGILAALPLSPWLLT